MEVSVWFIVVFVIMWAIGPATQVLQLIAPKLHFKLGLMEKAAFEPEFKWFLLEQRGIAYADLTFCFTAIVFVWLAIAGSKTALIFGLYTSACYVYFTTLYLSQLVLLSKHDLHPVSKGQRSVYVVYMGLFIAFGLFGLFYLWELATG